MLYRINKYIAATGLVSRRKADILIDEGKILLNGKTAQKGDSVDSLKDVVLFEGKKLVLPNEKTYLVLNKPAGYITAVSDDRGKKTVMELFDKTLKVVPVGRLDRDTTGVLLFSNDGDFVYRLTHPKFEIEKTYIAELSGAFSLEKAKQIEAGIEIDGHFCKAKSVEIFDKKYNLAIKMVLTEGRKHEVKELVKAVGLRVLNLKRISFAGITAKNLPEGKYRLLTKKEVEELKKLWKTRTGRPSVS